MSGAGTTPPGRGPRGGPVVSARPSGMMNTPSMLSIDASGPGVVRTGHEPRVGAEGLLLRPNEDYVEADQEVMGAALVDAIRNADKVQAMAQSLGISPDAAKSTLAQLMPMLIDKLTPNGSVPEQSNLLQMGENVLASFCKTGT